MGYWCPPQSSKLPETCVPGLVGSIPTQSRQLNNTKGSSEFLIYIEQTNRGKSDSIISWLISNNEEFRECLKDFWRLKWKAEMEIHDWELWKEPYRTEAEILFHRMNEIIKQNHGLKIQCSG